MKLALVIAALLGPGCNGDCKTDSDCGGSYVCARDHECLPPDEVVSARIEWTIDGQPPTMASCAHDLRVMFSIGTGGYETAFGFAPIPCIEGVFNVDKLPSFESVRLGFDVGGGFWHDQLATPNDGNPITFDLHP